MAKEENNGEEETIKEKKHIWIARNYARCSGCRRCEIVCSLSHEGKIWPSASRIRIFMLMPGLEVPHLCVQCHDYPCVESCPTDALSISPETEAVKIDIDDCIACGLCIEACPGKIPYIHPSKNHILICDLCEGEPKCVEECAKGRWNALEIMEKSGKHTTKLYARTPEEITKDLDFHIYGNE